MRNAPKSCPQCGGEVMRVLYMAAPMWLCADPECICLFGFWSWVVDCFPLTAHDEYGQAGWGFIHFTGPYWRALWRFLRGN